MDHLRIRQIQINVNAYIRQRRLCRQNEHLCRPPQSAVDIPVTDVLVPVKTFTSPDLAFALRDGVRYEGVLLPGVDSAVGCGFPDGKVLANGGTGSTFGPPGLLYM